MADNNILNFDVPEGDLDAVMEYLSQIPSVMIMVGYAALPKIGREILVRIRRDGPRSAIHRGPAKKPRVRPDKWRSELIHAIDTIRVSPVRRDVATNMPYLVVGPGRGDNTPSFYLKFFEYGRDGYSDDGRPFIRPARNEVMRDIAADIVLEEANRQLRGGGGKK